VPRLFGCMFVAFMARGFGLAGPSARLSQTALLVKKLGVYTGEHQHAYRKGSHLALALARSPPKIVKEKQQHLMRIQHVVSHAIHPVPSPPEASRSTSNPPIRSPIITVVALLALLADLVLVRVC